jgi:hypothetical protein
MQKKQAATADTGTVRLDDRQGSRDRHGRVERIAAGGNCLESGFRRQLVRARDCSVARFVGRCRIRDACAGNDEYGNRFAYFHF